MTKIQASRYHDFSAGHRVVNHESKCQHLHGHNYRVHFFCEAETLDSVGRVIDFSVIREKLCQWLEDNWDHKFIAYEEDPVLNCIQDLLLCDSTHDDSSKSIDVFEKGIEWVPFNPTAENMAHWLVEVVGPQELKNTGVTLTKVTIEETAKCHVTYEK